MRDPGYKAVMKSLSVSWERAMTLLPVGGLYLGIRHVNHYDVTFGLGKRGPKKIPLLFRVTSCDVIRKSGKKCYFPENPIGDRVSLPSGSYTPKIYFARNGNRGLGRG